MYLVKSGHLTAITLQTKHISRKKNKFISISSIVLWEVIPWLIKIRKYGEVTMISCSKTFHILLKQNQNID